MSYTAQLVCSSTILHSDSLKYVSVFSGSILDAAEFLCDDLLYGPNCLFINNNLKSLVLICSIRRVKCTKRMSLLNLVLPRAFLIPCRVERKSFVL